MFKQKKDELFIHSLIHLIYDTFCMRPIPETAPYFSTYSNGSVLFASISMKSPPFPHAIKEGVGPFEGSTHHSRSVLLGPSQNRMVRTKRCVDHWSFQANFLPVGPFLIHVEFKQEEQTSCSINPNWHIFQHVSQIL